MKQARSFFSQEQSFFWGVLALVWQFVFFYIPISFLISASFVEYVPALGSTFFTLSFYKEFFNGVYITVFLRSLALASTTVGVTLLIAYPVAYYLAIHVKRFKVLWLSLLILPFWTNLLLLVYAWYFLLENDGILNSLLQWLGFLNSPIHMINTPFSIYMGTIYCYLPFMLLPLYSVLDKFDKRLLEASADLGASYFQTFIRIILPLTYSGIRTGAILVFVPSFGEFVIPSLLGGDKTMFVGSVITHYFLTVRNVSLGSSFTCLSTLVLVGVFMGYSFLLYCIKSCLKRVV